MHLCRRRNLDECEQLFWPKQLLSILHNLWEHKHIDLNLTHGNTIYLYKHKGTVSQPTSYRPITLLPNLLKAATKLLTTRIMDIAEPLLLHSQHGFRPNNSTADNLTSLQTHLKRDNNGKIPPLHVPLVNFSKAFDRFHHEFIWFAVEEHAVPKKQKSSFKH